MLMKAERDVHLKENINDKGNGYYERKLGTPVGVLGLDVPRDRDGDFRPQVLPDRFKRDSEDRFNTLQALFLSSYSPNAINSIFNSLGLRYSKEELETLKKQYLDDFNAWSKRELPGDVIGIFIDAYVSEVKDEGKVKKLTTFVILGFDFEGFKDIYAIELHIGNETKEFWLSVFNKLIDRGLKNPLFVISDDFAGIIDAVKTLFPNAFHQLCYVHLKRNIRKNMGKADAKQLNDNLTLLKSSNTHEQAVEDFKKILSEYEEKYPHFIKYIKTRSEYYFNFVHLPLDVRKFFYTTNAVESFNSILENKRNRAGGFFQSMDYLKVNIYIHYQKLKTQNWSKPSPLIRANLYSFNQLFARRYNRSPYFKTQDT
jgi:transposase-like protein